MNPPPTIGESAHSHQHGSCPCHTGKPIALQQTLEEMDFDRGLWGLIARRCSVQQVDDWLAQRRVHPPGGLTAGDLTVPQDNEVLWANYADRYRYTPLHYASRDGNAAVCALLIDKYRVDPWDRRTPLGQLPLHRAAMCGHVDTVKVLLDDARRRHQSGDERIAAAVRSPDGNGLTALQWAEKNEYPAVAALLSSFQL